MEQYYREYPLFSLCGLNCGLCPRYHTQGESKCPGCGGEDFNKKHPSCAVINCNKKHDNVHFCYMCSSYPCGKYLSNDKDSFITYKNVTKDFNFAQKEGVNNYIKILNEKIIILEFLLNNYNDGRRKNFYCLAVNLLNLEDLIDIVDEIKNNISRQEIKHNEKINLIIDLLTKKADKRKIELKLRK
ncbi:MAG: DUF3795 domain-containing protein [Eubacteriaceae bacterium]